MSDQEVLIRLFGRPIQKPQPQIRIVLAVMATLLFWLLSLLQIPVVLKLGLFFILLLGLFYVVPERLEQPL